MSAIRLLIFLLFAGLVASCGQLPELNQKLSEIDSLTWTDPDSAYSAICQFDKSNMKNGRDSAMYRLLWAELRDKTYHDDTATNEISKAVLYFKLNDDCYKPEFGKYKLGKICFYPELRFKENYIRPTASGGAPLLWPFNRGNMRHSKSHSRLILQSQEQIIGPSEQVKPREQRCNPCKNLQ